MIITAAQTNTFFEHQEQMGIPHGTVVQLQQEGITDVANLADFDKESLKQLADNLRRPGGQVLDPNLAVAAGTMIPTPAVVFGVKSQTKLSFACDLVCYYETAGCDLVAANMRWTQVGKNLDIQWKALKAQRVEDDLEVPEITESLPIIKWTDSFQDFLY